MREHQQQLGANDLCRIAFDLTEEHGAEAMTYARRAVATFEAEGAVDRARFWFTLCVILNDIEVFGLDPELPVTLN